MSPGSFGGPPTILNENRSCPSALTRPTIVPPLLYSSTSVVPDSSYLPSNDCALFGRAIFHVKRSSLPSDSSTVPPPIAGAFQFPTTSLGGVRFGSVSVVDGAAAVASGELLSEG